MSKHTTDDPAQEIPYGYCHCGCGRKTSISRRTDRARGIIAGQPYHYLKGHAYRDRPARPPIERFWEYVDKRGPDDCWLWTGPQKGNGYGVFNLSRPTRSALAHRFSYELHNGSIPTGLHVCHKCDVPLCVNPAHLFVGTAADNIADMDAKGRRVNANLYGESIGTAKLTADQVREIRRRFENGESRQSLADAFGVDHTNIWLIAKRKSWRHLE